MKSPIETLDEATAAFIEGTRLFHLGCLLQSQKKMLGGLDRINEATDFIDEHSQNGRDILLPLLQSKEDSVRIAAASALIVSHTKIARSVVDDIHQNCITEARISAINILVTYETFGDYISGLCKPDPRYPRPTRRKFEDPPGGELVPRLDQDAGAANDSTASVGKS